MNYNVFVGTWNLALYPFTWPVTHDLWPMNCLTHRRDLYVTRDPWPEWHRHKLWPMTHVAHWLDPWPVTRDPWPEWHRHDPWPMTRVTLRWTVTHDPCDTRLDPWPVIHDPSNTDMDCDPWPMTHVTHWLDPWPMTRDPWLHWSYTHTVRVRQLYIFSSSMNH